MNNSSIFKKALEIAANDFFKHGVVMKGFEKYITEKTTEEWAIKHVGIWIKKAIKEIENKNDKKRTNRL